MTTSGLVITTIGDVTVVNFRNASILDGFTIDRIQSELFALVDEQARRRVLLDFSQVKFLCSTMLGVLVGLQKKSQAIRGQVVICGLREELFKVFKIMNLHKVLQFADNDREAMRLFRP
jgi:anti-sigma B factor antagonist